MEQNVEVATNKKLAILPLPVLFTLIEEYKQTNVWTMLQNWADNMMLSGNKTYRLLAGQPSSMLLGMGATNRVVCNISMWTSPLEIVFQPNRVTVTCDQYKFQVRILFLSQNWY